MNMRFLFILMSAGLSLPIFALADSAITKNAMKTGPVSFQNYVADIATHRYRSIRTFVDSLRTSVTIKHDFVENNNNGIVLTQRGGFTFDGGINIDSIRIDSITKFGPAFFIFNFSRKQCVYIQQLEKSLGEFSEAATGIDQRDVYVRQLALPDGGIYRAYMNRGPAMLPDCIVSFDVDLHGAYKKQP